MPMGTVPIAHASDADLEDDVLLVDLATTRREHGGTVEVAMELLDVPIQVHALATVDQPTWAAGICPPTRCNQEGFEWTDECPVCCYPYGRVRTSEGG